MKPPRVTVERHSSGWPWETAYYNPTIMRAACNIQGHLVNLDSGEPRTYPNVQTNNSKYSPQNAHTQNSIYTQKAPVKTHSPTLPASTLHPPSFIIHLGNLITHPHTSVNTHAHTPPPHRSPSLHHPPPPLPPRL